MLRSRAVAQAGDTPDAGVITARASKGDRDVTRSWNAPVLVWADMPIPCAIKSLATRAFLAVG
jgi:hypothetical protein